MSTQSTPSVLFTHTTPQQNFRLLELPPDLAELLSSKNPPALELKSTPTPQSQGGRGETSTPDYVNLCTPTQTYRIRQVQSSNSLHIIRPSDGEAKQQGMDLDIVGGGDQDGLDLVDTMTSIAKCGSTLELHVPSEGFSAVSLLRGLLGGYDSEGNKRGRWTDEEEGEGIAEKRRKIIRDVFADVPVSMAQCERGWVGSCAFVLLRRDGGGEDEEEEGKDPRSACWRPSAGMKLEVWNRLAEGAVLQGIDLGKQFLVRDLWKSVLDDELEAPFPRPLFEAVVRRVCDNGDSPVDVFSESEMKWASIDQASCIRWIGETYLEAVAPTASSAIDQGVFVNGWKDQIPEPWREDVSVSKLNETIYMHPEPKTICFATDADREKVKKNLPVDASSATAAKKSRNWHELFKNQKKQKR